MNSQRYSVFKEGIYSRIQDEGNEKEEEREGNVRVASARDRRPLSSKSRKKRPASANPRLRISPGKQRITKVNDLQYNRSISPVPKKVPEQNVAALMTLEK